MEGQISRYQGALRYADVRTAERGGGELFSVGAHPQKL